MDITTLQTGDSPDQSRGHHKPIHKFPKFPSNFLSVTKSDVHGPQLLEHCRVQISELMELRSL